MSIIIGLAGLIDSSLAQTTAGESTITNLFFADISPRQPSKVMIQELSALGAFPTSLLTGGRFHPDQPISRAEALLLIYRGLALPVVPHYDTDTDGLSDANEFLVGTNPAREDTDRDGYPDWHELINGYDPNDSQPHKKPFAGLFKDIEFGSWQHDLVYQAARQELISGFTDRTFRPQDPISKIEFLKIIITAAGLRLVSPDSLGYQDVPTGHWSLPYLATALRYGLISGEQLKFQPDQPMTRLKASEIVYKLKEA